MMTRTSPRQKSITVLRPLEACIPNPYGFLDDSRTLRKAEGSDRRNQLFETESTYGWVFQIDTHGASVTDHRALRALTAEGACTSFQGLLQSRWNQRRNLVRSSVIACLVAM